MKKMVLRSLAGLLGVVFGDAALFYYTGGELLDSRITQLLATTYFCVALLHYAVTGKCKPFLPDWKKKKK